MNLDYVQIMRNNFFNALEGIFPYSAVGKTPFEVVDEDRSLNFKLLRYAKEENKERVLLIIPHIINRPYILDLNDDVSVIRKFCEHGFSVYMLDWGYPTIKQRKIVSSSKRMVISMVNKCISINLPIFYRIPHDLETINYPFSNHYL